MALAIVMVGVLLSAAAAGVFCAIADGRRGRHVAPLGHRPPAPTYIDRFYAPRVTLWIGEPQPSAFADIAEANPDLNLDVRTYADLYLVPEETR